MQAAQPPSASLTAAGQRLYRAGFPVVPQAA
jgi:hypothetical protein